jgi:hypothetical protein
MRRAIASLCLALPFAVAAQTLSAPAPSMATATDGYGVLREAGDGAGVVMPLWRAADGRMLALVSMPQAKTAKLADSGPDFSVVDASSLFTGGLAYDVAPHVRTHVSLSQRSWLDADASQVASCEPSKGMGCVTGTLASPLRMVNGEVGATFRGEHYSVGVAVSKSRTILPVLPRVLPNGGATASGLPLMQLNGSTNLTARGRLALGQRTGIDVGASVGRIRLLPGNVLGVSSLGQTSLSLGMDRGAVSGRIVGRLVQPNTGDASLIGANRSWTSIDLGITVRLPWQGQLSFGAQNLWSSGQLVPQPSPTQPDQSRIPYVQYHQDL